ncbi:MAG: tRNA/rRNA methyltransferase [Alphaproteobacteria bacterium]|jgi:tRNA/rRNA methyltransferase
MVQNTLLTPKIILVRPQIQENIGATARAMANFSLSNLSLVKPREALGDKAYAMSSGASDILDNAHYFQTPNEAVADCHFILATTARHRDVNKPVYNLHDAIDLLRTKQAAGNQCGFLFGPERTGLENSDLQLADAIINVPVNPEFASLNLAQCVLLIGYEYFKQSAESQKLIDNTASLAPKLHIDHLLEHLTDALDAKNFFYPPEKRTSLISLISNIFTRNHLTDQEVGVLRGVIKHLTKA